MLLLLLLLLLLGTVSSAQKYCFVLLNDKLYDFNKLDKDNQFQVQLDGHKVTVYLNLCAHILDESQVVHSFGLIQHQDTQAEPIGVITQDSSDRDSLFKSIPKKELASGVSFNYSTQVVDGVRYKGVLVDLLCNATEESYRVLDFQEQGNYVVIRMASVSGCPNQIFNLLWHFINRYYYLFGTLFILLGTIECFYGSSLQEINHFISGYGAFFCIIMFYGTTFIIQDTEDELYIWLLLVSASVMAMLLGYLTTLQKHLSHFINGGWLGFIMGLMLYNLGLYYQESTEFLLYFYLVPFSLAVIMALLELTSPRVQVISTGVVGSYFTIRGLSLFVGFYPNEFEVAYLMPYQQSMYESLIIYYPYFAAMVILAICGCYMQLKQIVNQEKKSLRLN